MINDTKLAVRIDGNNPFHHLWNNNGTWWCHYTVHCPDFTKDRVRVSLRTTDAGQAQMHRDRIFAGLDGGAA